MKTFKELHESIKTAIDEVIVTAKDDKQRSGVRKTGLTVKAGVDDAFAKKNNQAPYFSVTHDHMNGNSYISGGIASASHIRQLRLSPEHTSDLMRVHRMHLRSAIDGSPMHAQASAEYHAGIGEYAPKGGNAEHLAHHLGTHLEHAKDIISKVNSEKSDEKKKGIVKSVVDSLRPEWQKKADEANAAIDRLSKAKLTTNESVDEADISKYATAIMNGKNRIDTGFGSKSALGVHAMLDSGDDGIASALMNGKQRLKTSFGDKTEEGIRDMIRRHKEESSTNESVEELDEAAKFETTGGITIHPKNNKRVSDYDVNGNPIVRYSVDGGRKKSIQIPYSMSSSDKHCSPSELHDEHPLVKLVKSVNESVEDLDEAVKKLVQGDEHDKPWHEMTVGARELALHGNDSHLYHSSYVPCVDSLKKKIKSGKYDRAQVPQLAKYHAERAADSYAKEYGTKGQSGTSMFTPEDRKQAAHYFASTMHSDAHEG